MHTREDVCLSLIMHAGGREGTRAKADNEEMRRMRQERANHFAGMFYPCPTVTVRRQKDHNWKHIAASMPAIFCHWLDHTLL